MNLKNRFNNRFATGLNLPNFGTGYQTGLKPVWVKKNGTFIYIKFANGYWNPHEKRLKIDWDPLIFLKPSQPGFLTKDLVFFQVRQGPAPYRVAYPVGFPKAR